MSLKGIVSQDFWTRVFSSNCFFTVLWISHIPSLWRFLKYILSGCGDISLLNLLLVFFINYLTINSKLIFFINLQSWVGRQHSMLSLKVRQRLPKVVKFGKYFFCMYHELNCFVGFIHSLSPKMWSSFLFLLILNHVSWFIFWEKNEINI